MDNLKDITTIKVDLKLKSSDSKFLNSLYEINKKDSNFKDMREFIEFVFMTGFTFVRGQFIGSMIVNTLNGSFLPIPKEIKLKECSNGIEFTKAFFDGEPAEFKISIDKETLQVRQINNKKENKWHDIYLLNKNKPLKWKGNVL